MKRAALGFRMHSGWGVLVAVCGDAKTLEVLDRRRIVAIDPKIPGAKQPYHFVETFKLPDARKHLQKCATVSERLAHAAVQQFIRELDARDYRIVGAAIILASGRALPPLQTILTAHPLLHTAEGEFFRDAARKACARLKIPVTAFAGAISMNAPQPPSAIPRPLYTTKSRTPGNYWVRPGPKTTKPPPWPPQSF